jgi:hypothetical protein
MGMKPGAFAGCLVGRRALTFVGGGLIAVGLGLAPNASAASCKDVRNPYPDTRYEGVDLTRIEADGVGCAKARRVAKRAHKVGLAMTPPPSGIRTYNWNGWSVRGNLRPDRDRYRATKHGNVVGWRF